MTLGLPNVSTKSGVVYDNEGFVPNVSLVQDREMLGNYADLANWSVFNDDTENLVLSVHHVIGTKSIEFDKANGGSNTKFAIIENTSTKLDLSRFLHEDQIKVVVFIPNLNNVDYVLVRIGRDSANYNEWQFPSADITVNKWSFLSKKLYECEPLVIGEGWWPMDVRYVAFGVAFSAEQNILTNIRVESVYVVTVQPTA